MSDTYQERLLINFWEAHPVGHVIEALRFALGYRAGNPEQHIALLLNAASPSELVGLCSFVDEVYPIAMSGYPDKVTRNSFVDLSPVPRRWDYLIENGRRQSPDHMAAVPGFKNYYEQSDQHFEVAKHRGIVGFQPPAYIPNQQLLFTLPMAKRDKAKQYYRKAPQKIAVLLAGANERWLYPSLSSWESILSALSAEYPEAVICLLGKHGKDERTSSSLKKSETDQLLSNGSRRINGFDIPLLEQMALIEAADVFIGPHSGFCFLAPTLKTPWLALSGGRWPEYFFNGVPFHSVMPDPAHFPWFTTFDNVPLTEQDTDGEGPRAVSMSQARFEVDKREIVVMAGQLMNNEITYESALANHFPRLLLAAGNDPDKIWSFDGIHRQYL